MPSGRLATGRRVQWHKGARLRGRQAEQEGNLGIVIRRYRMEGPSLKG